MFVPESVSTLFNKTRDPVSTMQAGKGSHVIIYMARKAIQGDDWQDSDGGEEAQTNVTVQSTEML